MTRAGCSELTESSGEQFWRRVGGPILTAVAALAVELLLDLGFPVPMPSGLLLLVVAYATFMGGLPSGGVSVAIGLVYYAVRLSAPDAPFHYPPESAGRLVAFALVSPALVLLVGALKARLERSLAEARLARAAAEKAARRLGFLAEASRSMSGSLDSRSTLEGLTRHAVDGFAELCAVDLVEGERFDRVSMALSDPSAEHIVEALRERYAPVWSGWGPAVEMLAAGEPVVIDEVTEPALERFARDDEHRRLLRALEVSSVMAVPMVVRERTLGVITFACTGTEQRYDQEDLGLAEELASRAALALDNARLYERALDASRAKSDFLAAISHDFRTPLGTIRLCTEQLRTDALTELPDRACQPLERIDSASRQLLQLIDQLLEFSRVDAERPEVSVSRATLEDVVEELAHMIEPLAREKGLRLLVDVRSAAGTVLETDTTKVKQVLLNLLSNAVRFTAVGEVRLRAWLEAELVRCEVTDTGVGIAPEDRERIFEPFWSVRARPEDETDRERGGTGLGLSVARRLCRLLGGDISVQSEPGRGSSFLASFPARWTPREPTDALLAIPRPSR